MAVVVVVAFLALVAISAASYVLTLYGFTLAEQGDDLHLRHGLFQVRNLTIPRRRVQHVTVVDNPVRRLLGIVSISLHSAAPLGGIGHEGAAATRFEIPILPRRDIDAFLHALMGGDWHVPALIARPPPAKRRAITRRVVVLAVLLVVPSLAWLPFSLALLLFSLLGVPWGLVAHRRAGHIETAEIVVLSHGALRHHLDLLPHSRVQSTSTEQNPLQRWSGVTTLHVNVAGPSTDPHLYDMADAAAAAYRRDLPRRSNAGG
jgi:putative membrane protein